MLIRLLDKFIFAALLLIALQVPQLADHYQQHLAGQYEATKWQVEGYQNTARNFGYPNLEAMLAHHEQNSVASVRADAQQKRATLEMHQTLQQGLALFEEGTLIEKAIYMANPQQFTQLEQTLTHFKPGLPLSYEGVGFGVITAILLNALLSLPFLLLRRRGKRALAT